MNQNIANSREQWLADQTKKRSVYKPLNRKLENLPIDLVAPQRSYLEKPELNPQIIEPKHSDQLTKPNPFPFNRQHKSRVLYRSLNKPDLALSFVNTTILNHTNKNNH
jgi:hypothetical protein